MQRLLIRTKLNIKRFNFGRKGDAWNEKKVVRSFFGDFFVGGSRGGEENRLGFSLILWEPMVNHHT